MQYQDQQVRSVAEKLKAELESAEDKRAVLRSADLAALYDHLKTLPAGEERARFGQEVNALKSELEQLVREANMPKVELKAIDVTAPFDVNTPENERPKLLPAENATRHPLMTEQENILSIFARMGFEAIESRELDNDYYMFSSLNFPPDHPARDDYDTFITDEGLIAPAHTSTMQNRVMKARKKALEAGEGIRYVIPGRVFRNEDLDARHEHTFYQLEGVYVDKGINAGNLIATLKSFLEEYYGRELKVKTQPFYFPFTEPSFEFAISCPFCDTDFSHLDGAQGISDERESRISNTMNERASVNDAAIRQKSARVAGSAGQQGETLRGGGQGCNICSYSGWIELLGCGMIHPNVLKEAGIDANTYTGFAWGMGIDRLVMMKYGVEDVRHFHSGNLKFLRQFR